MYKRQPSQRVQRGHPIVVGLRRHVCDVETQRILFAGDHLRVGTHVGCVHNTLHFGETERIMRLVDKERSLNLPCGHVVPIIIAAHLDAEDVYKRQMVEW